MSIIKRATIGEGTPLFDYLLATLGMKRKGVKELLKYRAVAVNGQSVTQFDHWLNPGDKLEVTSLKTAEARSRLRQARIQIVYEDDVLVVADKPAGLLTVATEREKHDTLFVRLNDYFAERRDAGRNDRALVVHRLDQETSGLVLFAKNEAVKRAIQDDWANVEKIYLAVVEGRPKPAEGTIDNHLIESSRSLRVTVASEEDEEARRAVTHYRTLQSRKDVSLVQITLETGRKHQIRVHMAELETPVVGDERYGSTSDACGRLALHAGRIALKHPTTGKPLSFHSPLPKAMSRMFPQSVAKGSAGKKPDAEQPDEPQDAEQAETASVKSPVRSKASRRAKEGRATKEPDNMKPSAKSNAKSPARKKMSRRPHKANRDE